MPMKFKTGMIVMIMMLPSNVSLIFSEVIDVFPAFVKTSNVESFLGGSICKHLMILCVMITSIELCDIQTSFKDRDPCSTSQESSC